VNGFETRQAESEFATKTHDEGRNSMFTNISRRQVLKASAALGVTGAMGALARPAIAQSVTLTLTTWGNPDEEAAFRHLIDAYKKVEPGVTINLEIVPGDQQYQRLDTRLAGGQAPDLVRIQYQQIGRYALANSMVELGPMLKAGYMGDFSDVHRKALSFDGKQFAMPFDNNTLALYYDKEAMEAIGEVPPTTIDKAGPGPISTESRKRLLTRGPHLSMAMTWSGAQAYRWLVFLYQHGGSLLNADLSAPAINSKEGIETIAWTASWFRTVGRRQTPRSRAPRMSRTCSPMAAWRLPSRANGPSATSMASAKSRGG